MFAALRLDLIGAVVMGGAVLIRLASVAGILTWGFQDREGIKSLWLLPIRDLAGLVFWALAFAKRIVIWRGAEFILHRDGRMELRP